VKTVEKIRALNLSGKGLLHMKDITIFDRMTSLETLDITGHPEFLMSEAEV
jgi:hypothetical protein